MKKKELLNELSKRSGVKESEVQLLLDALTEVIMNEVPANEKLVIPGLGTFKLSKRAARKGRNPQTGGIIDVAASKSISFKLTKGNKEALNK